MATNAARYRMVAGKNVSLLEFGLRRAQGPDGGLSASKYAYVGELLFFYTFCYCVHVTFIQNVIYVVDIEIKLITFYYY